MRTGIVLVLLALLAAEIGLRAFYAVRVGPNILWYGTTLHRQELRAAIETDKRKRWSADRNDHTVQFHENVVGNYSKYFPNEVRFDRDGTSRFEPISRNFDDALGTLLGFAHAARCAGQWPWFKLCGRPGCRQAFFDFTKNHSGRWCSRRCGDTMRARIRRRKQTPRR